MSDSLEQPNPNKYVESLTTGGTGAPEPKGCTCWVEYRKTPGFTQRGATIMRDRPVIVRCAHCLSLESENRRLKESFDAHEAEAARLNTNIESLEQRAESQRLELERVAYNYDLLCKSMPDAQAQKMRIRELEQQVESLREENEKLKASLKDALLEWQEYE